MRRNSVDDRTVYLEPQDFGDRRKFRRQFSANDSGIVDLHGSRNNSRLGLSIPNDTYRGCDSDNEPLPGTPRDFSPGLHKMNGHSPLRPQFSYPTCAPTSESMRGNMKIHEEIPPPNRIKDDSNVYTSIDEATLTFHGDSRAGSAAPLMCSFQRLGSRQTSIDCTQAKGTENIVYEPPGAERGRDLEGPGKTKPLSRKRCCRVFFNLIAVIAFALAIIQLTHTFPGGPGHQPSGSHHHGGPMAARNEELNETLMNFENKLNEVLDFLIMEINSKIASAEKAMVQLVSERDQQLKTYANGLMPVNMSACKYDLRSVRISALEPERSTDSYGLNDKFLLRVFCTTDGGTDAYLEYTNQSQYRCTCKGRHGEAAFRYCILHYWSCPYI